MQIQNVQGGNTAWLSALWAAAGTVAVALIAAVALPVEVAGPVVLALPFFTMGITEQVLAG